MAATYELEAAEQLVHRGPVCGIDEAGRGPWAGPVVAAAVILTPGQIPAGIADSKDLSPEARERLYGEIMRTSDVAVAIADVARIDRDNILNATLWAMRQACDALPARPVTALIDGNRAPHLDCRVRTIVKGDARCLSIAAASIIAKVTRDRMMIELSYEFPHYGFEKHKGYGTPAHRAALDRHGITPHHRRSFRPVQLSLEEHRA